MPQTTGTAIKLTESRDLAGVYDYVEVLNEAQDGFDLVPVFRDFAIVEGPEEVEQAIHVRLRTRRGEDVISPDVGLPIAVMMGVRSPSFIEGIFRQELLKDPRLEDLRDFVMNLDPEVRRLDVAFSSVLKDTTAFSLEATFGV